MVPMLIEIVSDLVCPWCYIGRRRLDRALALRPDCAYRIQWRVFQLNPELPAQGMDRQAFLAAKFGSLVQAGRIYEGIATAGAGEGIAFRFDRIRRTPNTQNAHRLSRYAARFGLQAQMIDALFKAYFEQGLDLGRIPVLAEIAGTLGFERAPILRFLDGNSERDAVLAEDRAARHLGIHGVPCFIIDGKYAMSGAQDPEFFLPLLDLGRRDDNASAAAE
jgi:predicted DsbA family dithiol-disulfide isomerase